MGLGKQLADIIHPAILFRSPYLFNGSFCSKPLSNDRNSEDGLVDDMPVKKIKH